MKTNMKRSFSFNIIFYKQISWNQMPKRRSFSIIIHLSSLIMFDYVRLGFNFMSISLSKDGGVGLSLSFLPLINIFLIILNWLRWVAQISLISNTFLVIIYIGFNPTRKYLDYASGKSWPINVLNVWIILHRIIDVKQRPLVTMKFTLSLDYEVGMR